MDRTEIIKLIIDKYKYNSYLEIGCSRNANFKKISITKVGVDPSKGGTVRKTSDDFFKENKQFFDIIFIDGLHHCEQVYKDIVNALSFLNNNGTIIIHDCNPMSFNEQVVPRLKGQRRWNGDVWKAWLKLRGERGNLTMFVVDVDEGCGIIRSGEQKIILEKNIEYNEFAANRKCLLNLISVEEFKRWVEK